MRRRSEQTEYPWRKYPSAETELNNGAESFEQWLNDNYGKKPKRTRDQLAARNTTEDIRTKVAEIEGREGK